MRIVIIGNGVAGIEAAITVRNAQPDWQVVVISEESEHFFSRTALMWVACGQLSHADIEPHGRDLYARMGLERVRGRAVGVDLVGKRVRMAGAMEPVAYDRLLIAAGSRPRPAPWPGADLAGMGHFVTLQDLAWLEAELGLPRGAAGPPNPDAHLAVAAHDSPYRMRPVAAEQRAQRAQQPAVIGGGLIGIEAVEVCLAAGLCPRFFIREEWFWPMAIDARESVWICDRMREHGVEVHLEHDVQALLGAGGLLTGVRTDRGEYSCDLAVVAIGVVPNAGFLAGSGLDLSEAGGVLVDRGLAANAPDVFAAGDCAVLPYPGGARRPEQLWYTARDQGRVAGRRLLGEATEYHRGEPYNSAKLMDIEFTTAGRVGAGLADEREWFFEERGDVRATVRIVTVGQRVVGFNLLGRRWDHSVLTDWIAQERGLSWVLDHLGEASFDSEWVPPLAIPTADRQRPAVVAGG